MKMEAILLIVTVIRKSNALYLMYREISWKKLNTFKLLKCFHDLIEWITSNTTENNYEQLMLQGYQLILKYNFW